MSKDTCIVDYPYFVTPNNTYAIPSPDFVPVLKDILRVAVSVTVPVSFDIVAWGLGFERVYISTELKAALRNEPDEGEREAV